VVLRTRQVKSWEMPFTCSGTGQSPPRLWCRQNKEDASKEPQEIWDCLSPAVILTIKSLFEVSSCGTLHIISPPGIHRSLLRRERVGPNAT